MRLHLNYHSHEFYQFIRDKVVVVYPCNADLLFTSINFPENSCEEVVALWEQYIGESSYELVKISEDDVAIVFFGNILYAGDYSVCKETFPYKINSLPNICVHRDYKTFLPITNILPGICIPTNSGGNTPSFWPFMFRNMENIFTLNSIIDGPDLEAKIAAYDIKEQPIITPAFYIFKNEKGLGNTILFRGDIESISASGQKTIQKALSEEIFWENVLIPILTEDFSSLKEEFYNQQISDGLKIRMFNISLHRFSLEETNILENDLTVLHLNLASHEKEVIDTKIAIAIKRQKIEEHRKMLEARLGGEKIKKEIQAILRLPYISDICFNGTKIVFTTEPIQIDDGPFLGGYEISYDVAINRMKIVNQVNPMHGCEHPHIQRGVICYGNYSDIEMYFATGDFYVGIELMREFLSTYNAEDEWGDALIFWDAKYAFENIINLGSLNEVSEEYDEYYYDLFGKHLPSASICSACGMIECECSTCDYCGNHADDCECWICPECLRKVGYDCNCTRCPKCEELLTDCDCERCNECDKLIDPYDEYPSDACTCERCIEDYFIYLDEDTCSECENWDCENNANEDHATTQDEVLF